MLYLKAAGHERSTVVHDGSGKVRQAREGYVMNMTLMTPGRPLSDGGKNTRHQSDG